MPNMNALAADLLDVEKPATARSLTRETGHVGKNGHTAPWFGSKGLSSSLPARIPAGVSAKSGTPQPKLFENLLFDLVARMASPAAEEAEAGMALALKSICDEFALEGAALWRESL